MSGTGRSPPVPPLAIHHLDPLRLGALPAWPAALSRVAALGFTAVCVPPPVAPGPSGVAMGDPDRAHPALGAGLGAGTEAIAAVAQAAGAAGLALWLDLAPEAFAAGGALAGTRPDLFRRDEAAPPDPRRGPVRLDVAVMDLDLPETRAWWGERLADWVGAGVAGFLAGSPGRLSAEAWAALIAAARGARPEVMFAALTNGQPWDEARALKGAGFDALSSSVAWWNGRDAWLMEERAALPGPLLAFPALPGTRPAPEDRLRLGLAAALGDALLVPDGFGASDDALRAACATLRETAGMGGATRVLSAPGAPVLAVARAGSDLRVAEDALVVLANADTAPATLDPAAIGAGLGAFTLPDGPVALAAGEVLALRAARAAAVRRPGRGDAKEGVAVPRIGIEAVTPLVDGGRFAVKRTVGEVVTVEADIVADTHTTLAAALLWRAADEDEWREVRMRPLGNDRWTASFPLSRLGRHQFAVEAWVDAYAAWRDEVTKKTAAGVNVTLELEEGRRLLASRGDVKGKDLRRAIEALAATVKGADDATRLALLTAPETAALMQAADPRPQRIRQSPHGIVDAERLEARFASWYEVFPRSQSGSETRHGTFADVIRILPRVQAMGFDVLYFPPIHPIGRKNRKGRNNTLTPGPEDVGSPYAIGSEEGGHDAIHRELGTLEDFHRLRDAAAEHGLELALDFAIQCSPDHPWLKEHPGWFDWRPDGTIKYAENPPKRYEDIVNVDFYAEGAKPSLWVALHDAVRFWVDQGVKIFRVDNPHTKPLPFWEWMIGEIRATNPEVIFLSEAFTRPKVMYRLAKVGFSQSYTYFTWRETKAEMAEYLTELSTPSPSGGAPCDFFRPNFFVNTPDINPRHLQTGGRPMHLARAALAATLSGLWGVYQGFELCEATPLPGKEEYLDSEKYQIRVWPERRPGDIVDEVTRLNHIRRANPALWTHLGVTFLPAANDAVLFYEKATADRSNVVLIAVSMDPSRPQDAAIEMPLWHWNLPDGAALEVEDLMTGRRFTWNGKQGRITLTPEQPFLIWRAAPQGGWRPTARDGNT
ncbi:alpha-1,4-glucan--maltose-1-phosphate maltosyltransferase [Roseomonas sp. CCTCC AB2023176]|uniref:alpha-1,4-glucan--maltose-1-phosphate maltosyltransferase n=1 Tax=Roseomonas sp. CCTCC AB2023176 TaxID=3342640 RepID=UPI0035D7C9B0